MTVVAIHQPNFFPWLGYFDKIARSDRFVFLDHVQYQKTGGNWSNRVQLMVGGAAQWVTAPIVRSFHGVRAVNEIEFVAGHPWREKLVKTLAANYARAPFYAETMGHLEPLIRNPDNNLARYNSAAVMALSAGVGLDRHRWRWSSALGVTQQSNELLMAITNKVGGDTYLSGGGAGGYQEDALFAAAGLGLRYQSFVHPPYQQRGAAGFVPGLSIIDALMHCGRAEVSLMLRTPPERDGMTP